MISRRQILKMIELGASHRLIERILANGRCDSPAARRRLTAAPVAAAAALGLALQRLCELSYAPDEAAAAVAQRLKGLQRSDDLFGAGPSASPAATAVAAAGLLAWRQFRQDQGVGADADLAASIESALAVLAALASACPPVLDDLELEIVIWQLGRCEAFRRLVPVDRLAAALARRSGRPQDEALRRFALAAAA